MIQIIYCGKDFEFQSIHEDSDSEIHTTINLEIHNKSRDDIEHDDPDRFEQDDEQHNEQDNMSRAMFFFSFQCTNCFLFI